MNFIDGIFFFYIFVGLYMLSLFLFLFFPNRKLLFTYPKGKVVPVSIIVPCFNSSTTISRTIDSLLRLDYPKEMVEIIVVDDKSDDNSVEIVRNYTKRYILIAFGRKLLDLVDSVYVTPGPFALYRKDALIEVGLFDTKNLTQDIEIVWRLLSYGYKTRMCLSARVYSESPGRVSGWWKQRIRWNIGGTQTLLKYKKTILGKGILGNFIIPFFSISLFIGLFGLGLFIYLFSHKILVYYLIANYSIYGGTALVNLQDLSFAPSLLNFFGVALLLMGVSFTLISLIVMNYSIWIKKNILNIPFYLFIYLMIYPVLLVVSLYKFMRGNYSW